MIPIFIAYECIYTIKFGIFLYVFFCVCGEFNMNKKKTQ